MLSGGWGTPGRWSVSKQDLSSQILSVFLLKHTQPLDLDGSQWMSAESTDAFPEIRTRLVLFLSFFSTTKVVSTKSIQYSDIPSDMDHCPSHELWFPFALEMKTQFLYQEMELCQVGFSLTFLMGHSAGQECVSPSLSFRPMRIL